MDIKRREIQLNERKIWLDCLIEFVRPGKIIEFGCGSGFVLESLSENFKNSMIVGVDKNMNRLKTATQKGLSNTVLINADMTENIWIGKTFDTVIFVGSLHEVYSYLGRDTVFETLKSSYYVLRDKGVLIIQDFLKPLSRLVSLSLRNDKTRRRFNKFVKEFHPRKVEFKKTVDFIELDVANAVEFISKYRSPSEEDWLEEMNETHFFFTEGEFKDAASRTGFLIKEIKRLFKSNYWWDEVSRDIEFEPKDEYYWIQLVLEKD